MSDRMPPQDIEVEESLIASMMIMPEAIDNIRVIVPDESFLWSPANAILFRTLCQMRDANHVIDCKTVEANLKTAGNLIEAGGMGNVSRIIGETPSAAHAEHYASIVRESALRRRLITTCSELLHEAYDSVDAAPLIIQRGQERLANIEAVNNKSSSVTLSESLHLLMADMDEGQRGLPSGLVEVDNLTAGFNPGDMIVVAARTSVGKTSFAMGIAEYLAVVHHVPVGIFSLEMSHQQLTLRMLCGNAGVDSHKFKIGKLGLDDQARLRSAVGELSNAPIIVEDSRSLTITRLRHRARDMVLNRGVKLIVVDYLQQVTASGRSDSRQESVSEVSRGIKLMAMELGVPIIAISQLNRSSETENRIPKISDIRESGAIENDADLIIILHSEEVSNRGNNAWAEANPNKIGMTLAIIAKHRNGPCGTVQLTYLKTHTRFVNYTAGT